MKYYKGDIVEILNIPKDASLNIGYNIGQRYIVGATNSKYDLIQLKLYWPEEWFKHTQIRLYHRPLKNHLKALFRL